MKMSADPDAARLQRQMEFVLEIDKLKHVLRRTLLVDGSRRENSAEHSWHLALMALVLEEYADVPIDVAHVLELVLVHDIVEIDAGDTFAYDVSAIPDQALREARAAARLFALLPDDQGARLRALWQEFEARETPDARYAAALDRLQPMLHNYYTHGGTWQEHRVTRAQVEARASPIRAAAPRLWAYVQGLLDHAVAAGWLRPDE